MAAACRPRAHTHAMHMCVCVYEERRQTCYGTRCMQHIHTYTGGAGQLVCGYVGWRSSDIAHLLTHTFPVAVTTIYRV